MFSKVLLDWSCQVCLLELCSYRLCYTSAELHSRFPVFTLKQLRCYLQARPPSLLHWLVPGAEAQEQAEPELPGHGTTIHDVPAGVELDLTVVTNTDPRNPMSATISPLASLASFQTDDLVRQDPVVHYDTVSITLTPLSPSIQVAIC